MHTYKIPLVPGPTVVAPEVLAAYLVNYGSSDLEEEFFRLYEDTEALLRSILQTKNKFALMSGEAMVVLWGALKSCLRPGDRVLCVATGVFGYGVAEMAKTITNKVGVVGFEYDEIADPNRVEDAIQEFQPKMVTMVHCETPSGTLNPVAAIGELIRKYKVPLFYVDAVSSAAGTPLKTDEWNIDLCLVGTQKCLSAVPDLGIISVSDRAWEIIHNLGYQGYDALAPWEEAVKNRWFPYTMSWHALAGVKIACERILSEGLEQVIDRHARAAEYCRQRIRELGLELYPKKEDFCSPTVTAVKVPAKMSWKDLDTKLRVHGMAVGGSLGPLADKVFRIGHMGRQANLTLLVKGMEVLEEVLRG